MAQSLLWLVAYFWHFTRPALAILLDPDLKQEVARFIGASNSDYTNIEPSGSRRPNNNNNTPTHRIPREVTLPVATTTTTTTTTAKSNQNPVENVEKNENEESAESLLQNSAETEIC